MTAGQGTGAADAGGSTGRDPTAGGLTAGGLTGRGLTGRDPTGDHPAADHPPGEATAASARRYRLPIAALILLAFIWGYAWVIMKVALDYVDPFPFSALRTFLGAVALFIVLPILRRPLRPKALGPTALLGLLQTTGFVGLLTWALEDGGAGKTSILTYTMPFWLLLMAWVVLGEKLRGFQWVAVGLALCGLVLILAPWRLEGKLSDFLAVGGALCWAASAVYAKILRKRHEVDLLSLTAWQMLLGSIPLIVISAATWTGPPRWTGTFITALVYVAILGNAVAWILWLYILDSFRAGTAGLATLLTPVIGIVSAWIQLGERPGVIEGVGMIAIVGALVLVVAWELTFGAGRSRRRRASGAPGVTPRRDEGGRGWSRGPRTSPRGRRRP